MKSRSDLDLVLMDAAAVREALHGYIDELVEIAVGRGVITARHVGNTAKSMINILISAGTIETEPTTHIAPTTTVAH